MKRAISVYPTIALLATALMALLVVALSCSVVFLLTMRAGVPRASARPGRVGAFTVSFLPGTRNELKPSGRQSAPAGSVWSPRGVGGGGAMYSPSINPRNPNEIYVACDMSPQFHTADLAQSWSTIDFRMLQSSHESAVRFTHNPDILWTLDYTPVGGGDTARPSRST